MYRVIMIGSNPAVAARTTQPFDTSTKSGTILKSWLDQINFCELIHDSYWMNVANHPTPKNRPLTRQEIRSAIPALQATISWYSARDIEEVRIVTVGKTASIALTLLRIPFFEMPHPSGLNRQLNDPKFLEEKLKGLKEYLSPSKV